METRTMQVIENDSYVAFPPARRSLAVTSVTRKGRTLSSLGLARRQSTLLPASATAMTGVIPTSGAISVARSAVTAGGRSAARYIDSKTVVRFDDVDPFRTRIPPV